MGVGIGATNYGEKNDPNTVVSTGALPANRLMVGDGVKGVVPVTAQGLPIAYPNGEVGIVAISGNNKTFGSDASGNITVIDVPVPTASPQTRRGSDTTASSWTPGIDQGAGFTVNTRSASGDAIQIVVTPTGTTSSPSYNVTLTYNGVFTIPAGGKAVRLHAFLRNGVQGGSGSNVSLTDIRLTGAQNVTLTTTTQGSNAGSAIWPMSITFGYYDGNLAAGTYNLQFASSGSYNWIMVVAAIEWIVSFQLTYTA